ncbi:hypothetical protein [Hyphomonas sp.]|uniref:hypothetical protein n=1 Tax=Hyphomonas sp. TaxID=87 RepID=UPI000C956C99|nr:hypothetical protein [Hyphomonas sp.]MAL46669.1 hypothetical protein [Hyphomonas sp.]
MKPSAAKKQMNQASALGSRKITIRNIPGCGVSSFDGWYTADAGVTAVSNAISVWKNNVPGGPSLTQGDADERPALTTVNGLTALDFDGDTSSKNINADSVGDADGLLMDGIGTGDFYIAFVLAGDAVAGTPASQVLFSKNINASGVSTTRLECRFENTRFAIFDGSTSLADTATGQLVQGQTTLVEFHRLNGTLQIFKNGTSIASESDSTDLGYAGQVKIGASMQNRRNPFNGQICEFICNAGTVTVRNRQIIEALMARKWNLGSARTGLASRNRGGQGVLPADAPFRNTIPRF